MAEVSDLLGRLAVHYKMLSLEQLAIVTEAQAKTPDQRIGDIMVGLGFINQPQLTQLLEAQRQHRAKKRRRAVAKSIDVQASEAASAGVRPPRADRLSIDETPSAEEAQIAWRNQLLAKAAKMNASDIHLHAGRPVKARVYGDLVDISGAIPAAQAKSLLSTMLTPRLLDVLNEKGEVDFAFTLRGIGRFRTNVYIQNAGWCAAFHYIPATPPTLDELGLPPHVTKFANHHNGIVLITGPAGSGKTSTMAAFVDILNEERSDHILCIEDPIEYVHQSKRCIVNQREVNRHTRSFAAALRSALREDPDVICIGELRDLETIQLAMSAAQTGHLVFGTMHTMGAIRTINRIVGAFPPERQGQISQMLAESLRGIISQKLLPVAGGGGVALALELLVANQAACNLIRDNRTFQLNSILQTGSSAGMCRLDDSLATLVKQGLLDKASARMHADNPETFA